MTTRIGVLGPVRIADRDAGGVPMRALLASLALAGRGSARSVAALAEDIWGDEQPQNPKAALQTLVSRARSTAGSEAILSTPAGYALGTDDTDLALARRLLGQAHTGGSEFRDRCAMLAEAAALWRGEPGADLAHAPVAQDLAAVAALLRDEIDRRLAEALMDAGDPHAAAALLHDAAVARPLDETVHLALIEALVADARPADGLAVFARLRASLREELGSSPGPAITERHAQLLRAQESGPRIRIGVQAAPNELIGREAVLAETTRMLGGARVVTILGPGGLGKTRLAHAVAAASSAGLVVVVPLAGVREDAGVPIAVGAALGISESSPARLTETLARPDLRARIVDALGDRGALVVLDNCEQVIDGAAALAADLLAAVPDLRILATSRTPLAISAERVLVLNPLSIAEDGDAPAVRLFFERARAARPGTALDAVAVARLCAHLDGLPLAIELAAARVRTMTVAEIEERLSDRFSLLRSGDRSAPERHRTLEAVIGWSWDLLDADAQRALAMLSFLPGGFSAATADAILDAPSADVLDRLVAQSLLVVVEDPDGSWIRFRMLETVREFGLSKLAESGLEDEAWTAARRWVSLVVDTGLPRAIAFPGGVTPAMHREIGREHDNLVFVLHRLLAEERFGAALRLFALIGPSWLMRGSFTEMLGVHRPVLSAVVALRRQDPAGRDADPGDITVGVSLALATIACLIQMDPLTTRAMALLRLWRRHGTATASPPWRAIAWIIGTYPDDGAIESRIDELSEAEDPRLRLLGLMLWAQFGENQGDAVKAFAAARSAWEQATAIDERWAAAMSADSAGQIASQSARPAEALVWLDRARDLLDEFDAADVLRQQQWVRGGALLALGRSEEAEVLFHGLVEGSASAQDGSEMAAIGWFGVAESRLHRGETEEAFDAFDRSLAQFPTPGHRRSPWYVMSIAGFVAATVRERGARAPGLDRWIRRMRGRVLAGQRLRPDIVDRPVLGSVLLGWSSWALRDPQLRDRGIEALALAEVLAARQDVPSLRVDRHVADAVEIAGADAVAQSRAAAREATGQERVERAFAVLRGR